MMSNERPNLFPDVKSIKLIDWIAKDCLEGDSLKLVRGEDVSDDGTLALYALHNTRTGVTYVIGTRKE